MVTLKGSIKNKKDHQNGLPFHPQNNPHNASENTGDIHSSAEQTSFLYPIATHILHQRTVEKRLYITKEAATKEKDRYDIRGLDKFDIKELQISILSKHQ